MGRITVNKLNKMKKLYVVTSGSYSDYGIDAIFDTKELAQAFIDSFKSGGRNNFNEIDEWVLNPNEIDLKSCLKPFIVTMDKEGCAHTVKPSDLPLGHGQGVDISFTINADWMTVYCYADDETCAIKTANDIRKHVLALNQWGKFIE